MFYTVANKIVMISEPMHNFKQLYEMLTTSKKKNIFKKSLQLAKHKKLNQLVFDILKINFDINK